MQVYLAAAMTNPSRDVAVAQALLAHLEAAGHRVPTGHVARWTGRADDAPLGEAQLARRDIAWVLESDALVAEVTTPSHGVGIEVAIASGRAIPVLLLYREGTVVSRLLLGLPGVQVATFRDARDACEALAAFLAQVATRGSTTVADPSRQPRDA
jgi:2'-deoxynucleoside 5'-phosphate N-hydrolase